MNKLIEFVENYKKSNPSGWRKVVYGIAAGAAALVVLAIFVARENARQREIARLNHQVGVLEQEAASHQVSVELASLGADKDRHQANAEAALTRANALKDKAKGLQEQHAANTVIINSLRSWSDVDAHVR